jgi:endoglucanase
MKTSKVWLWLVLAAGGCVIPPEQPPSIVPGSPASIGGTHAAAAPAPAAAFASPAAMAAAPKDCGAGALIDDGEDGNNQNLPNGGRAGYWYTFKDKGTTTVEPEAGTAGGTFSMSEGGHASTYAARFRGKIGTGAVVFSGLGMNFLDPKGQYDASKYAGVTFWARRGESSTGKVRLKVPDANTDPEGGVCTECFNDFGADLTLTPEWKQFVVPFKSMRQLTGWGAPHKPHVTPEKIYGLQFQVQVPSANYEIWIDDVKFVCE